MPAEASITAAFASAKLLASSLISTPNFKEKSLVAIYALLLIALCVRLADRSGVFDPWKKRPGRALLGRRLMRRPFGMSSTTARIVDQSGLPARFNSMTMRTRFIGAARTVPRLQRRPVHGTGAARWRRAKWNSSSTRRNRRREPRRSDCSAPNLAPRRGKHRH